MGEKRQKQSAEEGFMSTKSELKSAVKHTPGPWTIKDHGVMGMLNGRLETVATIYPLSPVEKSNARLIAAAPELLEACKELLGRLSQVMDNHPNLPDPNDSSEESHEWTEGDKIALDNARSAITKATGETL